MDTSQHRLLSIIEERVGPNDPLLLDLQSQIDFINGFKLGSGDTFRDWSQRAPGIVAICHNCGHKWIVAYLPMMPDRLAGLMARGSICPRCCEDNQLTFVQASQVLMSRDEDARRLQAGESQLRTAPPHEMQTPAHRAAPFVSRRNS